MCDMYLKDSRFIEDMEKTVVPKLSKMKESGYYGTKDGKRLYYEKFINENEHAVVVISHGFCEFAEKFEEVIYYFCARDIRYIYRSTEGMASLTGMWTIIKGVC